VRKAPLFVVFLTVFIDLLGFGILIPLLPLYAKRYGATGLVAGSLLAVYSAMQFVFAPIWGRLSDRVGRKPVLASTLAGNVLAYGLFAVASSLPAADASSVIPLLFVSRALAGICGANISTAQAYVADVTTKDQRARGMGMIGMAFGLGFVLGPALGGILSHWRPWAPGAAAATLSAVACVTAVFRLPESLTPGLRAKTARRRAHPILQLGEALENPAIAGLLALNFFLMLGFANLEAMLPYFLSDRYGFMERETGFVFAYIGVCIAFAQGFLVGRLARRYGERRVVKVGLLVLATGLQAYWLAPNLVLYLVAVPIVAIGMGVSNPSVSSLVSQRTPPDVQGRTLGLLQSLSALARAVSPALAGWLYDRFPRKDGSVVPFVWGGFLIAFGLALGWRALRPHAEDARHPGAPVLEE
jgi:DHA1 family tetracycline resistance protein-like MFS transporter